MRSASLWMLTAILIVACNPPPEPLPEPDAWGPLAGPGGPERSFEEGELWAHCAYLDGGEEDYDHHNFVTMHDGYLVLPWAPEHSHGGISLFEFDDPCAPVKVGETFDTGIRESHNMGFARIDGRIYAAVNHHGGLYQDEIVGGLQIWDLTDPTAPTHVSNLRLPGYLYPDAYARVTLSVFWQGTTIYVSGADNGVWMVDASDPTAPVLASQHIFTPPLRVGSMHVVGNLAMVATAEGARTLLLDVSEPETLDLLPGGEFLVSDRDGVQRDYYFANIGGRYGLFARKESGGGFIAYDLSEPTFPVFAGDLHNSDGNGGYVFRHETHLFVGDSNFGSVFDATEIDAAVQIGRGQLEGDLDTVTPVGNVMVLAVDKGAEPGQASAVAPYRSEPDRRGPRVDLHSPRDGDIFQATSSRIGLSFDEMVDFASVFEGSFRVTDADGLAVAGLFTAQENIVNFAPLDPLLDDTTYVVTVPAGGIVDFNGNPTEEELSFRFSTGAEVEVP